jgi:hypothetical protein
LFNDSLSGNELLTAQKLLFVGLLENGLHLRIIGSGNLNGDADGDLS